MQVAIAEQTGAQQAAFPLEGGEDGWVLPGGAAEHDDAFEEDVDFAVEDNRCGAMGAQFSRLEAVAEGVAVAGGGAHLRSASFRLRAARFGGQVGGPFRNIIVRKKTVGGPPSRPFSRRARGGFRENRGWSSGGGASVAHGDEVGVDKGCSRAVILGVDGFVAAYPTPFFSKCATSFAFRVWGVG